MAHVTGEVITAFISVESSDGIDSVIKEKDWTKEKTIVEKRPTPFKPTKRLAWYTNVGCFDDFPLSVTFSSLARVVERQFEGRACGVYHVVLLSALVPNKLVENFDIIPKLCHDN